MKDAKDGAESKTAAFMKILEDHKAVEPVVIPLPEEYSIAEAMIVAGAASRRQAQGLADAIAELCHENGYEILGIEGKDAADWILVDCNDVIIHILLEEARGLYRLEELWAKTARRKEL